MGYRPLEAGGRASRADAQHSLSCKKCPQRYEDKIPENLCPLGRKLREQHDGSSWPVGSEFVCRTTNPGWEDYDNHECEGTYKCTVNTSGSGFPMKWFIDINLYRIPNCPLGCKLADDRFESRGYECRS